MAGKRHPASGSVGAWAVLGLICALSLPAVAAERSADTMMAIRLHGYGGIEQLRYERVPRPVAGPGQVRVRVMAAGVNPYDWKFRDGNLRRFITPVWPVIPGLEFAGVVEALGAGVSRWRIGDAVYGFVAPDGAGAYAEYVVVPDVNLVAKPASMDFEGAAALPVATQTAWKALIDLAQAKSGQHLLLQGGSGSVGLAVLQLARDRGIDATAVASGRHAALMRRFGAGAVLDYRSQDITKATGLHDIVIDGVGAATLPVSLGRVRDGGALVSLNAPPDMNACAARRLRCSVAQSFRAGSEAVAGIAALVAAGRLQVPVGARFPLAQAAAAQEQSRGGGPGGKIVLQVAAP